MSSPKRRSIWLIAAFSFAFMLAIGSPGPGACDDESPAHIAEACTTNTELALTGADGSAVGSIPGQPTRSNGAVVWVWVAFSMLGLAVLAAAAAANRPPKRTATPHGRVSPLQESLAQLDRAS